jgi:hypothetical protein
MHFPYNPCIAWTDDHDIDLISDIANDTLQFRYMVSLLMKSTPELINLRQPLPIDFQFFFSSIFTQGLYSTNVKEIKEHSFNELYHRATFGPIWQPSPLSLLFISPKKYQLQNIFNFFSLFISHQQFFITI